MKAVRSASSSSQSITTTATASSSSAGIHDDQTEARDSCYFPGCRKDANCSCEICLASINATLDLMPLSIQRSSLTRLSKPHKSRSPVSFDSSVLSTPRSGSSTALPDSPSLRSTAKPGSSKKKLEHGRKDWECGRGRQLLRWILCFGLVFVADFALSRLMSEAVRPRLSNDVVRNLAADCTKVVGDLNGKIKFLETEISVLVEGSSSNCSDRNSRWSIIQDGQLLRSGCTFYKSMVEEVSIWGWPLQTAGLLNSRFSSRSFTIINGRVTEWKDGNMGFKLRKANSSWMHRKLSTSVVQFDPNTLILEYRQSSLLDGSGLLKATVEFLNYHMIEITKRLKRSIWCSPAFGHHFTHLRAEDNIQVPT